MKRIKLGFEMRLQDVVDMNESFAYGKCFIAYAGRNNNKSSISKEAFERSLDSIKNIPIVANYNVEENTVGGHDAKLVVTDKGLQKITLTNPFGVVPESAQQYWENIGGIEYLVTELILWKRQPVYEYIREHGAIAQSMEISLQPEDAHIDKDGYLVIDKFQFTALCALGDGISPCFEDANIQLVEEVQNEQFSASYDLMAAEFARLVETVDFSAYQNTIEKHSKKGETMKNENVAATAETIKETGQSFTLASETREELFRTVRDAEVCQRDWGECPRYCPVDYDVSVEEVYFVDSKNGWCLFGAKYAMNGDKFVVDFDNCKRKKYAIVDFNEGDDDIVAFANIANDIVAGMQVKIDAIKSEFAEYRDTHSTCNEDVATLKSFMENRLDADHKVAIDEVASEFADISNSEMFASIKKTMYDMDVESFREKCFAIRGRMISENQKFSAKRVEKAHFKVPTVVNTEFNVDPYGGLIDRVRKD